MRINIQYFLQLFITGFCRVCQRGGVREAASQPEGERQTTTTTTTKLKVSAEGWLLWQVWASRGAVRRRRRRRNSRIPIAYQQSCTRINIQYLLQLFIAGFCRVCQRGGGREAASQPEGERQTTTTTTKLKVSAKGWLIWQVWASRGAVRRRRRRRN